MPITTSGIISVEDLADEFGGTVPHSMSEYYGVAAGVPSSGIISISDFYGTSSVYNLGSTFPQYSNGGTRVMGTYTNLTVISGVNITGSVTATNPATSTLRVDRSTNNGSTWTDSVTVMTVTDVDQANGTETSSVTNFNVNLTGYNAVRFVHIATNQHPFAATTCGITIRLFKD